MSVHSKRDLGRPISAFVLDACGLEEREVTEKLPVSVPLQPAREALT